MQPVDSVAKALVAAGLVVLGILCASTGVAALLHYIIGGDIAAWSQAVGAILAIVSGFGIAFYQRREERRDASFEADAIAQASYQLAFQALETVGERLENILTPSGIKFSLQGDRTSEMVEAMREFDTSRLSAEMLKNYILLRSHVFAINKRISEIYEATSERDGDKNRTRHEKLESTVKTYRGALDIFEALSTTMNKHGTTTIQKPTQRERVTNYDRGSPKLV